MKDALKPIAIGIVSAILASAVVIYFAVFYFQPDVRLFFVRSCASDQWRDNTRIKACNDAYEEWRGLQLRGWRPLP